MKNTTMSPAPQPKLRENLRETAFSFHRTNLSVVNTNGVKEVRNWRFEDGARDHPNSRR